MPIMRLEDTEILEMDKNPELYMGMHAVQLDYDGRTYNLPTVSGVVLVPDAQLGSDLEHYLQLRWLYVGLNAAINEFDKWFSNLPTIRSKLLPSNNNTRMLLTFAAINPRAPLPSPPPVPPGLYGHLPFTKKARGKSLFYRWEAFPKSRRIDQKKLIIAAGTYASPASELPFIPTGFAAVGRNALPSLLPAVFRWELQPKPCVIHCGAGVPLYGQSGGGVEVAFPNAVRNRGPIANPVIIPAL